MIKFGVRQSFDKIQQVEERYANMRAAVEVALPYYWEIYEPVRAHLGEIGERIKSFGTRLLRMNGLRCGAGR